MRRPRLRRTGTEPVTAFSDLRLRLLLSVIFAPVFVVGATLLGLWWLTAETGGGLTSRGAIGVAALLCAAVAVFAVTDLVIVVRRLRRERRGGRRR
jgi:apolipoprotein N-acyltransferase